MPPSGKITININKLGSVAWWLSLLSLVLLIIACFCYLFSSQQTLSHWYLGLNSCIYRSKDWNTFFTPAIKSTGNTYCLSAICIVLAALLFVFRKKERFKLQFSFNPIGAQQGIFLLICLLAGIAAWCWGNSTAGVAFDEVFSAENVAGIHPFQSVSYYMLPNNHLLFCFINNVVFHPFADKVVTGRIISLVAYLGFIAIMYLWLCRKMANNWLACVVTIMLSLQFFVWGFSFQARSYQLCLLAEVGAFVSLFAYIDSKAKGWAWVNVLCIVTGFACVPSFLYFFAAQILFIILYQVLYGKWSIAVWKYQLIGLTLTFLFYLPVLCFSGIAAITSNPYVAPMKHSDDTLKFCKWMFPYFEQYIIHAFSGLEWRGYALHMPLLLLPLLLLFFKKNKTALLLALFSLSLWVTFFIIVIVMKRLPFERNIVGHYSFTLLAGAWAIYELSKLLAKKSRVVSLGTFSAVVILFSLYLLFTEQRFLKETLYEYNVNEVYADLENGFKYIPANSSVGFSEEGFFCCYLCRRNGCHVYKCPNGSEDYYVTQRAELLPVWLSGNYAEVNKVGDYLIFKKAKPQ